MRLVLIKLYKNNRINFGKKGLILYKPIKQYQLIYGINGSGKSSLGEEMNILPIDKENYSKDGYKEIVVENNDGVFFYFKYTHSYCKMYRGVKVIGDKIDIEQAESLNKGGTKTVQLERIRDIFGITPTISLLLNNTILLTNTPPSQRKSLFNALNIMNVEYAVAFMLKCKKVDNDKKSVIKKFNSDLIKLNTQFDNEEFERLLSQKENLSREVGYLESKLLNYNMASSERRLKILLDEIKSFEANIVCSEDEINIFDTKLKRRLDVVTIETENLIKNKDTLNKELGKSNISQIEILERQIEELISKLPNSMNLTMLSEYKLMLETLGANMENENIEELKYLFVVGDSEVVRLDKKISDISREISRLNYSTVFVKCKSCGSDTPVNDKIDVTLAVLKNDISSLIKEKNEEIDKLIKYEEALSRCLKFIVVENIKSIFNIDGRSLIKFIVTSGTSISSLLRLNDLYNSISELSVCDETYKRDNIINAIDNIVGELEKLERVKNSIISELQKSELIRRDRSRYLNMLDEARNAVEDLEIERVDDVIDKMIGEEISIHKADLKIIEDKLAIMNVDKIRIEYLTKEIEKLQKESKVSKVIYEKAKDLVDDAMNSSMNYIVMRINEIISKIWSYELELKPVRIEDDIGLDYRFAFSVKNKERSDITKASTSMKDIINLAFKLTVMEMLNLETYPILLDEFGSSMDENHSAVIYSNLENLLNVTTKGQVFIISHLSGHYGAILKKSDVNVINSDGLALPSVEINRCLKIKDEEL